MVLSLWWWSSTAGGEPAFGLDAPVQLGEVTVLVEVGNRDLLPEPAGQVDGVGQPYAVDPLAARGQQVLVAAYRRREVAEHLGVLGSPDAVIRLGGGVDVLALVELASEQPPYGVGVHRVADLLLRLGQPADGHLLGPVDDDLAAVAEDLQPVGPDEVVCAGAEDAGGAAPEVDHRVHLVLDGDVAAEAVCTFGEHAPRHAADPLPQVELVRRLVHQDPAALAAPGGPPVGLVVVALRPPPRGDDPGGVP